MSADKDSGLRPTPEFEAFVGEKLTDLVTRLTEEAKRTIWGAFSSTSLTGVYAVSFIERQAQHPCPHGGADDTCECYPHQARRFMARRKDGAE